MKLREAAAGLALVTVATGCSDSGERVPQISANGETPSYVQLMFRENGRDSDYVQMVNCQKDPSDTASVYLTNPRGDIVSLTLGAIETETKKVPPLEAKFIGGITIYAVSNHEYELVSSESPRPLQIDLDKTAFQHYVSVEGNYGVEVTVMQDGLATIQCQPPLG